VFQPSDFRLVYTCPNCGTKFVFARFPQPHVPGTTSKEKTWELCPRCGDSLETYLERADDHIVLWKVVSQYQNLCALIEAHGLNLKLELVTSPAIKETANARATTQANRVATTNRPETTAER
jgi:predicted RNA-binding Zn-ribbon protein involved in translation (DUF1610 family)